MEPVIRLLDSPNWIDYQLLDSGDGKRLERFGPYTFIRPDQQAIWQPHLSADHWQHAQATFQVGREENSGSWQLHTALEPAWQMGYQKLRFWARISASRHLGVFPEQATHWEWIASQVKAVPQPIRVVNLFGYTGLATLAAAQAGAQVVHVDASRKSVSWARENQLISGLSDKPIRWLVDDAYKFMQREVRRGSVYQGIILDPPKFGRGPKGEVWECLDMLPNLLSTCRAVLRQNPRFVIITAYAIRASALSLYYLLRETMVGLGSKVSVGELVLRESDTDRYLSTAIYARWSADPDTV